MSLFRRLGRRFECYRQVAKRVTDEAAISRCQRCGARVSDRHEYCPDCGHQPPHEVLDVDPDATDAVVKAVARDKLKMTHPDHGGSKAEFQRVKKARDRLLDR